jgi:hypothetical protein
MGDTYTRQSSYTDGDVITAAHTNDEFNQLLAAFATSSGHTHDGTTGEGGPITKMLGTALTLGDGTAGTDIAVTFDGETNDGLLTWKEDEDYFEFNDDILIASTEKIQFRDTGLYIYSSVDGQLDIVADTEVQIAATTIDINGAVDVSGNLDVGGNLTVTGTTTLNGGTLTLGDAATDNVVFGADVNSSIIPNTDDSYDLGSTGQRWKDAYVDGIAYIDAINLTGTAITSTAAELNIIDGDTSATSTTIADADRVVLNDNGTMVQVAVTDLAAYLDDEITAMPNLITTAATTVGALNSGSITSGFGTIDTGASAITTTGTITGGVLTVDDVGVDGKVITLTGSSGDTATITASANGALDITTTDAAGAAGNIQITADGTAELAGTTVTLDSSGGITLDADGGTITFADAGSSLGTVTSSGFTGNVVGNVTGNVSGTAGSATGNAATATALATARTIGGTSFDGTANIAVGLADTATALATARTIGGTSFDGTANIAVGLADTATALATARTIHGVSFDGTANIDLSEVVSDTVGAMVSSNTETGITVTYQDADNTIDFEIGAGAIVNSMLADDAVGADELAASAVVTASIVDANVTTAKIATDAITEAKIADNAVQSEHINDNVISGQTSLASGIADADELLISDAGSIKRTAMSVIKTYIGAADDATALAIALG